MSDKDRAKSRKENTMEIDNQKITEHYFVLLVHNTNRVNQDNATYYKTEKEAMKAFWKHVNSDDATGALLLEGKDEEEEEIASYAW